MAYTINIFTLSGCGHCKTMKNLLSENNLPYKEFEINENREIFDQVVKLTGQNVLPTIYLQDKETGQGPIFVPGRDYMEENEILEKIWKYIPKGS
jgi:glutaredoxin 3